MRKLALALGIAGLLAVLPSVASAGGQPTRAPLPDVDNSFDIPAGQACSFEVSGSPVVNNETVTTFPADASGAVRLIVTGTLREQITNVSTGKSIVANISGPATLINYPDGSQLANLHGRSEFVNPAGTDMELVTGHLVLYFSSTNQETVVSQTGTVEDVCAALS